MQTKHANYVFAERQHAKQHINPIDVMDEALYFIHNIIVRPVSHRTSMSSSRNSSLKSARSWCSGNGVR